MADVELKAELSKKSKAYARRGFPDIITQVQLANSKNVYDVAGQAEVIFKGFAPERSGRLKKSIKAHRGLNIGRDATAVVRARAVSDDGVDYLRITRFGHRVAFIYPVKAKVLRWWTRDGHKVFSGRTKGFRPTRDWVEDATESLGELAERQMEELARDVARNMNRP